MSTEPVLRSFAELGLEFPSDPLMEAAFAYAQKYCPPEVNNHVARSAYWALILAKRLPENSYTTSKAQASRAINIEDVVLICLIHDLGLANWIFESPDSPAGDASNNPLPGLLSLDKRFEVDCANTARDFVATEAQKGGLAQGWDEARLDRLWVAIALHATPSIARHAPAPEIALAHMAIEADFVGPNWSPTWMMDGPPPESGFGIITVQEYLAVEAVFPRGDFGREGVTRKLCSLCKRKPMTTFDTLTGVFGKDFGYDGKGSGREEYAKQWEMMQSGEFLLQALDRLATIEAKQPSKNN